MKKKETIAGVSLTLLTIEKTWGAELEAYILGH